MNKTTLQQLIEQASLLDQQKRYAEADAITAKIIRIAEDIQAENSMQQYTPGMQLTPGQQVQLDSGDVNQIEQVINSGQPGQINVGGNNWYVTHGTPDGYYLLDPNMKSKFLNMYPEFPDTKGDESIKARQDEQGNIFVDGNTLSKILGGQAWLACHDTVGGGSGQAARSPNEIEVGIQQQGDKKIPFIQSAQVKKKLIRTSASEFTLPDLPYEENALSPTIDAQTMSIHHGKHHKTYVEKLNEAIGKHKELKGKSIEELLEDISSLPSDVKKAIRNNGGGHYNHSMFWKIMSPDGGGEPKGEIKKVIDEHFGSFEEFKKAFIEEGKKRFGSGWVWLVKTDDGFKIISTPNQDNPIITGAGKPIFGIDLWEHAYYLKYKNNREDYLNAWWKVVNWKQINKNLNS